MKKSLPFRAWYYFRIGYATYLALIIATVNVIVTVYYLAIKNVPQLELIFPSFAIWATVVTVIGVPLAIAAGWLHFKRTAAYSSEIDVGVESNPYYYKLPPGYWKEAVMPTILEILRLNIKILNKEALSEKERSSLNDLLRKMETLVEGGYLGDPRKPG